MFQLPYINQSAPCVQESFSLHRAYIIVRSLGLRHLVVVDHNNHVKGIITRKDLMGFSLEERLFEKYHGTTTQQAGGGGAAGNAPGVTGGGGGRGRANSSTNVTTTAASPFTVTASNTNNSATATAPSNSAAAPSATIATPSVSVPSPSTGVTTTTATGLVLRSGSDNLPVTTATPVNKDGSRPSPSPPVAPFRSDKHKKSGDGENTPQVDGTKRNNKKIEENVCNGVKSGNQMKPLLSKKPPVEHLDMRTVAPSVVDDNRSHVSKNVSPSEKGVKIENASDETSVL